jgi:hypothetical protein
MVIMVKELLRIRRPRLVGVIQSVSSAVAIEVSPVNMGDGGEIERTIVPPRSTRLVAAVLIEVGAV